MTTKTFLRAKSLICKQYTLSSDFSLKSVPYPFVYEVTSESYEPRDLADFARLIQHYAALGGTLLKGLLDRPLVNESRAGHTDPTALTDWICLDLDGVDGYQNVDAFLVDIGLADISYVLQWSSSMGLENKAGLRCHVFMYLAEPAAPEALKRWLMGLNLRTPTLAAQLQLTKTNNGLRWPLDITTCQNDKLIYVAPPILGPGIDDPFPNTKRIVYHARGRDHLKLPGHIPSRESLRQGTNEVLARLRAAAGLRKRKEASFKYQGSIEYLVHPEQCQVTELKVERGFVYLNLNGGDSWGYYHPVDNPKFIYNFKGEPTYKTEELLPEYWASIQEEADQRREEFLPNAKGLVILAFRDLITSEYWNGTYDTVNDRLELFRAKSETQLRHFVLQHEQNLGEFVPDWRLVFDPQSSEVINREARVINRFVPSEYMRERKPKPVKVVPPLIHRVLDHVLAHDQECYTHFLNWLACILQFRHMTGTAWILHGRTGTGKGVLYHKILRPLIGESNTTIRHTQELLSEFNGFAAENLLTWVDESETSQDVRQSMSVAKVKNMITDPIIPIRDMYTRGYNAKNFNSWILASNKHNVFEVEETDRRFNIAPRQEHKLEMTEDEIKRIESELSKFYAYLMHYPASADLARRPLHNQSRQILVDMNKSSISTAAEALLNGNLRFFWDLLPSTKPQAHQLTVQHNAYHAYRTLLEEILTAPQVPKNITRDEVLVLFTWAVGENIPKSPNKFTTLLKHHGLIAKYVWRNRTVAGFDITWNLDPQWHAEALESLKEKKV